MSKWLGWWSGRSSPQAAASSASPADNTPQAPLDNPLYIPDALPLTPEEATAEAEPQEAYAASNTDVDLYGHENGSEDVLHDVSLSDSDDEPHAAAPPSAAPSPLASPPPLLPQLLSPDLAAAAASAPSPDSKDAAKDLDEAQAKAAILGLIENFLQVNIQINTFSTEISRALSLLPPKPLYQTFGGHKIQDCMESIRMKAEVALKTLQTNTSIANEAIKMLSLQYAEINPAPEANTSGVWKYIKIGGALVAATVVVSSAGTVALGALAAIPWGVTPATAMSGAIGVANSWLIIPILGAGATGGGVAATAMNGLIKGEGGINALIKEHNTMQDQAAKDLKTIKEEVTTITKEAEEVSKAHSKLKSMLGKDILSVLNFLANEPEDSAGEVVEWFKACAREYSNMGEDFPIAILAYSMVHPSSICLAGFELSHKQQAYLAGFQHSEEQAKHFGTIERITTKLYEDEAKKLNLLFNMAVRFMETHCQDKAKEFNDAEYAEWNHIASLTASDAVPNLIKFDLGLVRKLGVEDAILNPTIAAKKYQIGQYAAQPDAEADLDKMVKKDAVEILLGNKADIMTLIARSAKLYSEVFSEAEAEKYTAIFVYTIIDPNGSLDQDAYADSLQAMIDTAHDHGDINIRDIASLLRQNDHDKEALIHNIAKHLMKQSYHLRDGSGYDMDEFAENPIAKECADILGQTLAGFAEKIASALTPTLTVESYPDEDSHAMASLGASSEFAYGDLLNGGDYAFSAPALGESKEE